MTQDPTRAYEKTRDELYAYEASEFKHILSNVPNYYISINDQTAWGAILRSVAKEVARLEFYYAYDIVGKNPQYLNPADCKRQWAGPLFINRNYPRADQYDLDYKNLVINLLDGYGKGATTASIQKVLFAYTGQTLVIEELFKQIGSYYDVSDRNMIRVGVKIGGTSKVSLQDSTAEALSSFSKIKTITDDLYGAIDLAKPAHVGLNLVTIFGLDEFIGDYIHGRYAITDVLNIKVLLVEPPPLPDPLYQAPFLDTTHPDTGLASIWPDTRTVTLDGAVAPGDTIIHVDDASVFAAIMNTMDLDFLMASLLSGTKWEVIKITGANPDNTIVVVRAQEGTSAQTWSDGDTIQLRRIEPHPGLVSPILNRAWEIKSDSAQIIDLD